MDSCCFRVSVTLLPAATAAQGGLGGTLRQVLVLAAVEGYQLEPIRHCERDRGEGQHLDSW